MENNTLVWDNLVDAFLEDMKQFPIGDSLYAFVVAYNIATQEQEEDNKKMCEVWEEIDILRERIRVLESRQAGVYQPVVPKPLKPSKMYPDWTPHNPIPPWTVTCSYGTSGNTATLTGDLTKCAFNGIKND